jgi:hypothetical protein
MWFRRREMRFNPAPGWPQPVPGWLPDREWQVPADWPPAPSGWPVLVPADPLPVLGRAQVRGGPEGEVSGVVLDGPDGLHCAPGRHADGRRHLLFRWDDALDVRVQPAGAGCEVTVQLRAHQVVLAFPKVGSEAAQAAVQPHVDQLQAKAVDHVQPDVAGQLARLTDLHERGVLSDEDYVEQVARLSR